MSSFNSLLRRLFFVSSFRSRKRTHLTFFAAKSRCFLAVNRCRRRVIKIWNSIKRPPELWVSKLPLHLEPRQTYDSKWRRSLWESFVFFSEHVASIKIVKRWFSFLNHCISWTMKLLDLEPINIEYHLSLLSIDFFKS